MKHESNCKTCKHGLISSPYDIYCKHPQFKDFYYYNNMRKLSEKEIEFIHLLGCASYIPLNPCLVKNCCVKYKLGGSRSDGPEICSAADHTFIENLEECPYNGFEIRDALIDRILEDLDKKYNNKDKYDSYARAEADEIERCMNVVESYKNKKVCL